MYFRRLPLCASLNSAAAHSASELRNKRMFSTKRVFASTRADGHMDQACYRAVKPELLPDPHYLSL